MVYFKFRTPSNEQDINMTATVNSNRAVQETNYGNDTVNKTVHVYTIYEKTPPDPQAKDRMPTGFTVAKPADERSHTGTYMGTMDYLTEGSITTIIMPVLILHLQYHRMNMTTLLFTVTAYGIRNPVTESKKT